MRNIAKLKKPDYLKPLKERHNLDNDPDYLQGIAETQKDKFSSLGKDFTMEYAERGSGNKVIIFLHGYVDSWFVWSDVMAIMPSEYHCYAISHRGHGDSTKPESDYSMAQFSADLLQFMDDLGIDKADIVGHSMGGVIAQRFTLDHPKRVKRLVLVSTGANLRNNDVIVNGFGPFIETLDDPFPSEQQCIDAQITSYHKKIDPDFFEQQIVETLKCPKYVWQLALQGLIDNDLRAEIPNIKKSTLIVWGTADDIFPYPDQQDLMTIPDHKFVELEDIGHGAYWEVPKKFVNKLTKFLEKN